MNESDIQALVKVEDPTTLTPDEQEARRLYLQLLDEQEDPAMGRAIALDLKILKDADPPVFQLPGGSFENKISVIVIASIISRSLWPEDDSYSGPPMCGSVGGQIGTPNIEVAEQYLEGDVLKYLKQDDPFCGMKAGDGPCKLNKWGSDLKGGQGIACGDHRDLLVVVSPFETVMRLRTPPTSSKFFDKYLQDMKVSKRAVFAMYTDVYLESAERTQNETYALIKFTPGDDLPMERIHEIVAWRAEWKDSLGQMKMAEELHMGTDDEATQKPEGQEVGQQKAEPADDEVPF
jgi:hypothetical protein